MLQPSAAGEHRRHPLLRDGFEDALHAFAADHRLGRVLDVGDQAVAGVVDGVEDEIRLAEAQR